jgi:hypothetical protein
VDADAVVDGLVAALQSDGYVIERDQRYPQHMGDRVVRLAHDGVLIGIGSDRGDWLVEIGRSSAEMYQVDLWDAHLHDKARGSDEASLNHQVALLIANRPAIEALLRSESAGATLDQLLELALDIADRRWPGVRDAYRRGSGGSS